MSFTPARRPLATPPPRTRQQSSRAALERRRRRRHFARRRRDLVVDTVAALLLSLFTIAFTAGLGVIALLEAPVALALIVSCLLERRTRRRHAQRKPPATADRVSAL